MAIPFILRVSIPNHMSLLPNIHKAFACSFTDQHVSLESCEQYKMPGFLGGNKKNPVPFDLSSPERNRAPIMGSKYAVSLKAAKWNET